MAGKPHIAGVGWRLSIRYLEISRGGKVAGEEI